MEPDVAIMNRRQLFSGALATAAARLAPMKDAGENFLFMGDLYRPDPGMYEPTARAAREFLEIPNSGQTVLSAGSIITGWFH